MKETNRRYAKTMAAMVPKLLDAKTRKQSDKLFKSVLELTKVFRISATS
jgi:hypothetical protein